jgi:transposase
MSEKMRTSPYSIDLREKVIKFLETGKTQVEASQVFSLNKSTVNRWYNRYRKEGNCLPRKRQGAVAKINQQALLEYVGCNPDATLKEISREFGVSLWGIYYWFRKLGISYKKKPSPMWKQSKTDETNI